jgi:heme exporter protein C
MIAYLLARRYGGPASKRLAAALGLFAAADVPLVYLSVRIWRTLHPTTDVVPSLKTGMWEPFWGSFLAFVLLWGLLMTLRLRLEAARAEVTELELAVEDSMEART